MVTKYDVFAEIIEKAPCRPRGLGFSGRVSSQIELLISEGLVRKSKEGFLLPINNKRTRKIFNIIKWSLKNFFEINFWFNGNFKKILEILPKAIPNLNPLKLSGNIYNTKIINFLLENQFILMYNKRPKLGVMLNHEMFGYLAEYNDVDLNVNERFLSFKDMKDLILHTKRQEMNPFDLKIFEFLAGSAQLEGATVSIGETIELLTKDIYPDKSSKDIQIVKNLNEAFLYVLDNLDVDLSVENIEMLDKLCLFSLHRGAGVIRRDNNVKIKGNLHFLIENYKNLSFKLNNFCKLFNSIKSRDDVLKKIGYIHNEFQHLHPFSDGNSRVTRLIVNWLLMKFGFPLLILKKGSFDKYMSLTKLSVSRKDDDLKILLLHLIYHEVVMGKLV